MDVKRNKGATTQGYAITSQVLRGTSCHGAKQKNRDIFT